MRRSLIAWISVAGCSVHHQPREPQAAPPPIDGAEVDVGSLVQSDGTISIDVLIPAGGDLTAALQRARDEAKASGLVLADELPTKGNDLSVTVQLASYADEQWNHQLPHYIVSVIDPQEFANVDQASSVVRIAARSPATRAWELIRVVTMIGRDVASAQHGWIYDKYRAQLHDAQTLVPPELAHHDVRTVMRIMGVYSTKGELDHLRTVGMWSLGLPELYVDNIPAAYLDDAMDVVRDTAQMLIQNGGVSRRGIIEVDLAKLPADWPRSGSGTGRIVWNARWMRGPIHHNAMLIKLAVLGSHDKDPTALVNAIKAFTGIDRVDTWQAR